MSGGRPGLSPRIGIALAFALAGCGEDGAGPGNGAVPAFTISVTGDVERELEGTAAVQGEVTKEGETFWVLALDAPLDGEAQGVNFVRAGPFPGVGEHALAVFVDPESLAEDAVGAGVVLAVDGEEPGFLGASSDGVLAVASSLGGVVRGSFEILADGSVFPVGGPAAPGTVTATGDFTALPGAVSLP